MEGRSLRLESKISTYQEWPRHLLIIERRKPFDLGTYFTSHELFASKQLHIWKEEAKEASFAVDQIREQLLLSIKYP
jgi:hypothetical protein